MLLVGGSEQKVGREALGDWLLAPHVNDGRSMLSYGNLSRFVEGRHLIWYMQLADEMAEAELSCEDGQNDMDDLAMKVLNKRKS